MSRLLPHPVLSAMLFVGWLLLAGFTAGQGLLALAVALLLPWAARRLVEEPLGHVRGWRGAAAAVRCLN